MQLADQNQSHTTGTPTNMDACPHSPIEPSLDRWQECHWHLHQMESNYHDPEGFRYALNSFIRAAKEVQGILMADLQRHPAVREAIGPQLERLRKNELLSTLKKRRDFLVHRGMLELKSRGSAGTTEGSRIKISLPFPVAPHETSDAAYARYKELCRTNEVWRGLGPDCDSAPAIWRTWMIPEFPDRDLLEVAFEAWSLIGDVLSATVVAFNGEPLDLSMSCRHSPEDVKIKRYSQQEFFLDVHGIDLKEEERKWRERTLAAKGETQID
ncbi:MAG: hypothetical protein WDO56_15925 [Gammaproteobacteria bacterium]